MRLRAVAAALLCTVALLGVVSVGVGVVGGSLLSQVRAEGLPTTEPLVFRGQMTEGATLVGGISVAIPVTGDRRVGLRVWDQGSPGAGRVVCERREEATPVNRGAFKVPLPDSCVDQVRKNRDLWVEVLVDGASYGRERLTAEPYAVEAGNGVPAGVIVAFGGTVAPQGWLLCDGRQLPIAENENLYAAIGHAWRGSGALEAGYFRLPDLRGRFLRGVDGRTVGSVDPDAPRALGSVQSDELRSHTHEVSDPGHTHGGIHFTEDSFRKESGTSGQLFSIKGRWSGRADNYVVAEAFTDLAIEPVGGDENRPVNVAATFLIKR